MTLFDLADLVRSFEECPPRHVLLARLAAAHGALGDLKTAHRASPEDVARLAMKMSSMNR